MPLKQLLTACTRAFEAGTPWRLDVAWPSVCAIAISWGAAAPAVFNEDGSLQLPTGYRRWQHVGARVKTSGNSVLDGSKIVVPQVMDAYVEPGAFESYRRTGKWPEGTRIVKEFSSIETGSACNESSFICATPYGFGIFETRYIGLGMMANTHIGLLPGNLR